MSQRARPVWVAVHTETRAILENSARPVNHLTPAAWVLPLGFEWVRAEQVVTFKLEAAK